MGGVTTFVAHSVQGNGKGPPRPRPPTEERRGATQRPSSRLLGRLRAQVPPLPRATVHLPGVGLGMLEALEIAFSRSGQPSYKKRAVPVREKSPTGLT